MAIFKKSAEFSPLEKAEEEITFPEQSVPPRTEKRWWSNWEVYLILAIALILRLLFINMTQFMADHATFYQMAYDGVAYHLWPISGNRASTGPLIPPLFVYLMMIPAAISPNPVGGAIFIALCNVFGVLVTYLFTRRYYGRLAGTIAALLYATAINVIIFNRDIWQPDLLPPLTILFMWCLFRGVVEQKRYWFFPAVLLLGAMCQLHTTAIYLLVPLGIALLLAFRTIRVGEIALTGGALLLSFFPYLLLESFNHFADIKQYIHLTRLPATFSTQSLHLYSLFIRPTMHKLWGVNNGQIFDTHLFQANAHSIMLTTPLHFLQGSLRIEDVFMPFLLICALLGCTFFVLRARVPYKNGALALWRDFMASPERKGLLLLLAWQGLVLLMVRTSINLYIHYLLFLVPGQFVLLAIFLAKLPNIFEHSNLQLERGMRIGVLVLSVLIVFAQIVGSVSTLVDREQGNFDSTSVYPEYFDLATLQNILGSADQLAQRGHIARIYMPTSYATVLAVRYLAQFEKTPIVTFEDGQCVILPSEQTGPVVFIVPPYSPTVTTVLTNYAQDERLVGTVAHPGGAPFQIYILNAKPEPVPALYLTHGWQDLSAKAQMLSSSTTGDRWLMTRWSASDVQRPAPRTAYNYALNVRMNGASTNVSCSATATYPGDQIFLLQSLAARVPLPRSISVQPSSSISGPQTYRSGPFTFATFDGAVLSQTQLQTTNGEKQIVMDVASLNS